ncbi:MAG: pyridoxal phosphate-dependent aminotransferase [Chloroflexi bacterium]|nr:pyridoxal phosphate-dependent aminotransferase [Chloroflexota bacterium]
MAARARRIPGEGALETLSRALDMEARGIDIIHLEIGEPDFPTPTHIVQAGVDAIRAGRTRYGPAPGIWELREAIADHLAASRGVRVSPERIIVTPGGKPVIFMTVLALVEKGDEVIIPDPGFPAYEATVRFAGGTPVSLPLRGETGFQVNIDALKERITRRTKLLILNSPGNPTGSIIRAAELEAIAELALQHNLWLLSDEIYSQLYYDEPPKSIAAIPEMAERTILLDGFSKSYAMTGWRLGYGAFPKPLVEPVTNIAINNYSCTPLFAQDAGIAALRGPQDCVAAMREAYRVRRNLVVERLNAMPGVSCTMPAGAFYALPDVSALGTANVRTFTNHLLENGVAVLPGVDFGRHGEGYMRISFATAQDKLREGLRRIEAAVETLHRSNQTT